MRSVSALARLGILLAFVLAFSVSFFAQTPAVKPEGAKPVTSPRKIGEPTKQLPQIVQGGFDLPNGWRITPAGKPIAVLNDLVLNMVVSKDGKIVVATHSGFQPHGIDVFDVATAKLIQHIELKTTWLGLAWSADGKTLYVSGGNATGAKNIAPDARAHL